MAEKKQRNDREIKDLVRFPNDSVINEDIYDDNKNRYKEALMGYIIETKDEEIELKIKGSQYKQIGIHDEWRQVGDETYFSYQEKATKDFIYRFNRCGILSDQVGMGKTIEAGMIISELAYRRELGSLLILVPNENMAEKWETELARKFGFRNYYKDLEYYAGKVKQTVDVSDLPKVGSIKNMDSLFSIIYSAVDDLDNKEENRIEYKIKHCAKKYFKDIILRDKKTILSSIDYVSNKYRNVGYSSKECKMEMLRDVVAPYIFKMVEAISIELGWINDFKKANYSVNLNGNYYFIVDMYLDSPINNSTIVDGIWNRIFDESVIINSIVGEFDFIYAKKGEAFVEEMRKKAGNVGTSNDERITYIEKNKSIAKRIREKYAILIVSKIITYNTNPLFNLLNYSLNENYESESIKYCSASALYEKGYRVIDFLIDMSYKTLIVDEAHDYIRVSHKLPMEEKATRERDYEKRQKEGLEFDIDLSAQDNVQYVVFPLYDDYYFVEKECMYLKVKTLAERSFRKIFMTATPIKSDMIDFYLLYLLADNSDTTSYNRIRSLIKEEQVTEIAALILDNLSNNINLIKELNYYTHEDIVIKYLYQVYKKSASTREDESFEDKIKRIINDITYKKNIDKEVIKDVCVNKARLAFQRTFTIGDKEIDSISELVSTDEGIEQWQNMYSQIGIRSTRHQTFRLDDDQLSNIIKGQRARYKNLPIWAKRNGTVIYIKRQDIYFDMIVKKMLDEKKKMFVEDSHSDDIRKEFLDNPKQRDFEELEKKYQLEIDNAKLGEKDEIIRKYENRKIDLDRQYRPIQKALNIYNYISEKLTGNLGFAEYKGEDIDYVEFKLHMIAMMMTEGVDLDIASNVDTDQPKPIEKAFLKEQVLLFVDESNKDKVYTWLCNQVKEENMSTEELEEYKIKWKHYPVWYYNKNKSEKDKWFVTNDIKALSEKIGNYIIVVEPNKYEEGVDLQKSNTLINFDIKFCPLKMEQRIGRIDRVKLVDKQPELQIYSFTPLNDMSGFMVNFLANELKMFSCWKGDTTGIVSMPLGKEKNSATFESAIIQINEAYKGLYNYNADEFLEGCKKVIDLGANFTNDYFDEIKALYQNGDEIREDFRYLDMVSPFINDINFHSMPSKEGNVVFGRALRNAAQRKAAEEGNRSETQFSQHKNEHSKLKNAIESYYQKYMEDLQKQIDAIKVASNKVGRGSIEGSSYEDVVGKRFDRLNRRLTGIKDEYEAYNNSELFVALNNNSPIVKGNVVYNVTSAILNRYEERIRKYLNALINLFDKFCKDVKQRSDNMAKFISYLTIEEFKAMVNNNE